MGKIIKQKLPPIGFRIIKSAVAVFLCFIVSFLRGNSGIVFYSQLAALWCIQMYVINSRQNAMQRFIGTTIGAVYGLVFILLQNKIQPAIGHNDLVISILVSLMIIIILYTTVVIKKKQASYFSCVVFLSIVINHISDSNPYLFVWNRFLDTIIGIIIGIGVNSFSLPKNKIKDVLFISGLDDTLLSKNDNLTDFSKVELNRILDEGANFTISTIRTPASLIEPLKDIRLNLPVIAMDGAVLYDIHEKMYLKTYIISHSKSEQLLELINANGLKCFVNVIIDDMLVIYYDNMDDEVQNKLIKNMRKSPYRNYVNRTLPKTDNVVYIMLLYPANIIENFYKILTEQNIVNDLKVLKYPSSDYLGYSYIKIYNKNASKENMICYLKQMLNIEKTVTFGSIQGKYDIVVEPGDSNKVVSLIKKLFEPVKVPFINHSLK